MRSFFLGNDEYKFYGDDTCGVRIEDLIDEDTLKKYVRFYKVLLVQLAVNSPISRNNLTAFTNALGGQAISLDKYGKYAFISSVEKAKG